MWIDNSTEEENKVSDPHNETTPPEDGWKAEDPKEVRYKEQLEGRRLQAEKAEEKAAKLETMFIKTATDKVEQNNDYLLELYAEDPELADKVAKHFWVKSAKEAIAKINAVKNWVPLEKETQTIDPEKLYKEWEDRQAKKEAVKSAEKVFEWLDKDEKSQAKEMFKELTDGKDLPLARLEEIAEMSVYYVTKNSTKDWKIAKLASTALWWKGTTSNTSATNSWEELAKAMWLGHLYSKTKS